MIFSLDDNKTTSSKKRKTGHKTVGAKRSQHIFKLNIRTSFRARLSKLNLSTSHKLCTAQITFLVFQSKKKTVKGYVLCKKVGPSRTDSVLNFFYIFSAKQVRTCHILGVHTWKKLDQINKVYALFLKIEWKLFELSCFIEYFLYSSSGQFVNYNIFLQFK